MKITALFVAAALAVVAVQGAGSKLRTPTGYHDMVGPDFHDRENTAVPFELTGKRGVVINELSVEEAKEATRVHGLPFADNRASYSGLIEVDAENNGNIFFWFFEAEESPETAKTILWLQGGPGCSSMLGLFTEMGPISLDDDMKIVENPGSWGQKYNLIFIDQPFGAGYSFVENSAYATSTPEASAWSYAALQEFFATYPTYAEADFYIFGESYAGHWIGGLSHHIMNANAAIDAGTATGAKIPLAGLGVGDGHSDPITQLPEYCSYAQSVGIMGKNAGPSCEDIAAAGVEAMANEDWKSAFDAFGGVLGVILTDAGNLNVYDIRMVGDYDDSIMDTFLNLPETREMLHVGDATWEECENGAYFAMNDDFMMSYKYMYEDLLEAGYKMLHYNGQWDLIIATPTTQAWVPTMEWYGRDAFSKADRIPFRVDGDVHGYLREYENLSLLSLRNGGHMLPMDQPEACREMVTRFIENGTLKE